MLLTANFLFVMTNDPLRLTQARRGVEDVLGQVAVRAKSKKRESARQPRRRMTPNLKLG